MINNDVEFTTTESSFINSQNLITSNFAISSDFFPNYTVGGNSHSPGELIESKDTYDLECIQNLEEKETQSGLISSELDPKSLIDSKSPILDSEAHMVKSSNELLDESTSPTTCDANIDAIITPDANSYNNFVNTSTSDTCLDSLNVNSFEFSNEINLVSPKNSDVFIETNLPNKHIASEKFDLNIKNFSKQEDDFLIFGQGSPISEGDIFHYQCSLKDYLPTFDGAQKCAKVASPSIKNHDKSKHIEFIAPVKEITEEVAHKSEKNMRVLSELASGSLATCSSILDVGIDENVNQPGIRANTKIRSFISNDRIRRSMIDSDLPRRSIFNGSDSVDGKIHRNRFLTETECSIARPGLVKDRLGFFERAANVGRNSFAVRKSVSELKSRSLDPPPESSTESINNHDKSSPLPTSLRKPPASIRRRESETAVMSSDTSWDKTNTDSSQSLTPPALRAVNIQKLKAFFGETTPRIMEGKTVTKIFNKDGIDIKKLDSEPLTTRFDPAAWAAEKRGRTKKATTWSLSSHKSTIDAPTHSRHATRSTDRIDSSGSPKQDKTWRGKMVRTLKRYGSSAAPSDLVPHDEPISILATNLELCTPSFANEYVPLIVETCARIVEERGLENQGIYRVPGNSGAVNLLIEELNKDPDGLCLENEKWQDVNLVSSLLKLFFRKLQDSLITEELYEAVITTNRTENGERRMLKLKKLIHDLPEYNFETLKFIAQHLNKVASRESVNKMDAHNLAIVFGPTLVRPQDSSMFIMVRDMQDQCRIIESIIVHCDWFFSSWDEDVNVPVDEEVEEQTPITGISRELLAKAERLAYNTAKPHRKELPYKEIVANIFSVANMKIRKKTRTPYEPQNFEESPPPFRSMKHYQSESRATNFKSDSKLIKTKRFAPSLSVGNVANNITNGRNINLNSEIVIPENYGTNVRKWRENLGVSNNRKLNDIHRNKSVKENVKPNKKIKKNESLMLKSGRMLKNSDKDRLIINFRNNSGILRENILVNNFEFINDTSLTEKSKKKTVSKENINPILN